MSARAWRSATASASAARRAPSDSSTPAVNAANSAHCASCAAASLAAVSTPRAASSAAALSKKPAGMAAPLPAAGAGAGAGTGAGAGAGLLLPESKKPAGTAGAAGAGASPTEERKDASAASALPAAGALFALCAAHSDCKQRQATRFCPRAALTMQFGAFVSSAGRGGRCEARAGRAKRQRNAPHATAPQSAWGRRCSLPHPSPSPWHATVRNWTCLLGICGFAAAPTALLAQGRSTAQTVAGQ